MKRQMIATMGSTLALIGAIAAVAIVGTAAVVFDRWPAAGSDAPSATAPLAVGPPPVVAVGGGAGDNQDGAGDTATGATGAAAPQGAAPDGARPTGTDRTGTTTPGTAGPAPGREGATDGERQSEGTAAVPAQSAPSDRVTANEEVAGAVDGAGDSAGDLTRGSGVAAGAALGTIHAPSGGSAVTSTSESAESVEQAAEVVSDALRRLP